jgi:hypothetical protein
MSQNSHITQAEPDQQGKAASMDSQTLQSEKNLQDLKWSLVRLQAVHIKWQFY